MTIHQLNIRRRARSLWKSWDSTVREQSPANNTVRTGSLGPGRRACVGWSWVEQGKRRRSSNDGSQQGESAISLAWRSIRLIAWGVCVCDLAFLACFCGAPGRPLLSDTSLASRLSIDGKSSSRGCEPVRRSPSQEDLFGERSAAASVCFSGLRRRSSVTCHAKERLIQLDSSPAHKRDDAPRR